jgi:hypothetical protein
LETAQRMPVLGMIPPVAGRTAGPVACAAP